MESQAETVAGKGRSPVVARVYSSYPCLKRTTHGKIVPDAVVDLGDAGPVVLFWQCSAWSPTGNARLLAQPMVDTNTAGNLSTATYVNPASTHATMLRRRALTDPLPEGQTTFSILADANVNTDTDDTVNMVALDISDIGVAPLVRLSAWGNAVNGSLITEQEFTCGSNPLLVSVSATGFSPGGGAHIGALLTLDGGPFGNFQVFANPASQHMNLVGGDRVRRVEAGKHKLRLAPHPGTTVDVNDHWAMSVIEFPPPSNLVPILGNDPPNPQTGGGKIVAGAPYESKGGEHMICLWISAFATKPKQTLSAEVQVDGNPVGRLQAYATAANTHMLLCGGDIAPGSLPAGKHSIDVVAGPNTVTDANDRASLMVMEVFR